MANVESYLDELISGVGGGSGGDNPTLPDGWDGTKVIPEISDDGVIVPVPNGFTASDATGEHSVNEGFVIYEGAEVVNDENLPEAKTSRNQFVWIPVNSEQLAEMYTEVETGQELSAYTGVDATTSVYSNLRDDDDGSSGFGGIPGSTSFREPDILINTTSGDASTTADRGINLITEVFRFTGTNAEKLDQFADMLVANYEEAYESIKKYGGFYIGRYELTGNVAAPTVQKDGTVVTNANWYELYEACSNVVSTESAKSTMITGTQWDRVLEWLVDTGMSGSLVYSDSRSWGNYNNSSGAAATNSGTKRSAGYNEAWQANNIYDLAGNCIEWTQEAINDGTRVSRGGLYGNSGIFAASSRGSSAPYRRTLSTFSTRVALYVGLNAE